MKIKHLQLNTSALRSPEKIMDLIENEKIDIACLQEVVYTFGSVSPLVAICEKQNLNYCESVHFHYLPENITAAAAIISKYEILDYHATFYNADNFAPRIIKDFSAFEGTIVNDEMSKKYPGSRGLKHSIKSRSILSALLNTPSGLVKVITVNFTVSDLCTETIQMYEMSMLINSIVKHSKDIPTIFSGDLNIRTGSYSVSKISEVLTHHTSHLQDTLSINHRAKDKDFPEGLATDHVFSKGLKHKSTTTKDIDFSDHNALISEFEL